MKCFTLQADRPILTAPSFHTPITMVAPELYPEAREGIRVHRLANEIELAPGLKAAIAPELLAQAKVADDDPEFLIIERASLERTASGALCFLPEQDKEDESALVWLDLGRGAFSSVRYEVGNRVFLRARKHADVVFGTEELALVEVPKGRPFAAYRSSRRFLCFGGDVVGEQLQVRFDGDNVSCEPVSAGNN